MRDDEPRAFLRQVNPWWRAAVSGSDPCAWTAEDRSLRGRAEYDLGYRSPVLSDVATQPLGDGLYVLRGPRRVGKSVVLKDLVAALCARPDVDPREVVYLPVDTFGARDLRRSVALGLDLTRAASGARRVWLFDEITGVDGWTAEIKSLRDNTAFGESTVVLTGSSSAGAERAVRDLGAGRAGRATGSPFRTLLPMTFRSVLAATGVDVPLPAAVEPWRLQSPEAADRLESLALFVDDLDLAWQRYLETGGFPRAVGEHQRTGEVSTPFVADLAAWLTADVDPLLRRTRCPCWWQSCRRGPPPR